MPDLAVSNDTEIIAKVHKTAEILMIFKVHTYAEQTDYQKPGYSDEQSRRFDALNSLHLSIDSKF